MGMSYTIDRERRVVRSRMWGAVTTADMADLFSRILIDPRFEPDFRALADLREVTALSGDSMAFGTIASTEVYLPGTRRAAVATNDSVLELMRLFAAYSRRSGQTVRVFTELEEAERWVLHGDGAASESADARPSP